MWPSRECPAQLQWHGVLRPIEGPLPLPLPEARRRVYGDLGLSCEQGAKYVTHVK